MRALLLAALAALVLTGCANVGALFQQGAQINDAAAQTAEATLCRGISVGAWKRAYGSSPERAAAWRALCADTVGELPWEGE